MKKPDIYLVITIDTEADHSFNWTKSRPLTFNSITDSIPNLLEPVFKKYGAIGTYLLTAEVLENDKVVATIKNLDTCELGTHLHPEYIEPEKKYFNYEGTYSIEFSNNYSPEVEKRKISNITKLFEEKFGYKPLVYRGGKFGFCKNTASSLKQFGYLVDTSVTPNVSWKTIGGPDFRKYPEQPYLINGLLEVPISIGYVNIVNRIFRRPIWLRPSFNSLKQMKSIIDRYIDLYKSNDVIVLNMMFHSMELYPGASPYSKSLTGCYNIIDNIKNVIEYCSSKKIRFCRLSELKAFYS